MKVNNIHKFSHCKSRDHGAEADAVQPSKKQEGQSRGNYNQADIKIDLHRAKFESRGLGNCAHCPFPGNHQHIRGYLNADSDSQYDASCQKAYDSEPERSGWKKDSSVMLTSISTLNSTLTAT